MAHKDYSESWIINDVNAFETLSHGACVDDIDLHQVCDVY